MDDLILTQFVAGAQSQTLPMLVYSSVRLGVSPQINVLATIIVAVVGMAIVVASLLVHRGARSRYTAPAPRPE
jgi:putrescine transport system permease protein